MRVRCTHGNYVRVIARRCYSAVSLGTQGVVATGIAGGDNNDDTRLPCRFNGLAEWIELVTFVNLVAE